MVLNQIDEHGDRVLLDLSKKKKGREINWHVRVLRPVKRHKYEKMILILFIRLFSIYLNEKKSSPNALSSSTENER